MACRQTWIEVTDEGDLSFFPFSPAKNRVTTTCSPEHVGTNHSVSTMLGEKVQNADLPLDSHDCGQTRFSQEMGTIGSSLLTTNWRSCGHRHHVTALERVTNFLKGNLATFLKVTDAYTFDSAIPQQDLTPRDIPRDSTWGMQVILYTIDCNRRRLEATEVFLSGGLLNNYSTSK